MVGRDAVVVLGFGVSMDKIFSKLISLFTKKKATATKNSSRNLGRGDSHQNIEQTQLLLEEQWEARQANVALQWKRTLPFGDYFVDRWRKAELLGFGEGASVYDNVLIIGDVKVGKNTWIGPNTVLDGTGELSIGVNCSVSAGVQVYSHDTVNWAVSGGELPYEYAKTSIGDHCYIGPNAIVTKGVSIGNRCIIGANSVVLTDIPDNSKAVGNPCRVIGKIDF